MRRFESLCSAIVSCARIAIWPSGVCGTALLVLLGYTVHAAGFPLFHLRPLQRFGPCCIRSCPGSKRIWIAFYVADTSLVVLFTGQVELLCLAVTWQQICWYLLYVRVIPLLRSGIRCSSLSALHFVPSNFVSICFTSLALLSLLIFVRNWSCALLFLV